MPNVLPSDDAVSGRSPGRINVLYRMGFVPMAVTGQSPMLAELAVRCSVSRVMLCTLRPGSWGQRPCSEPGRCHMRRMTFRGRRSPGAPKASWIAPAVGAGLFGLGVLEARRLGAGGLIDARRSAMTTGRRSCDAIGRSAQSPRSRYAGRSSSHTMAAAGIVERVSVIMGAVLRIEVRARRARSARGSRRRAVAGAQTAPPARSRFAGSSVATADHRCRSAAPSARAAPAVG